MRLIGLVSAALLLAGCSSGNWGPNALQFNNDAVGYPENYRRLVVDTLTKDELYAPGIMISAPSAAVGSTPFSPKRWYVCVVGVPSPARASEWLPIDEAVAATINPDSHAGIRNLVFFFSDPLRSPTMQEGYDSPLCRTVQYEAL